MDRTGTPPRPGLGYRLLAALTGRDAEPAKRQSLHLPDLARVALPHKTLDIKDWERALNAARDVENPDRQLLVAVYDSLMTDSHLASVMESRVLRVVRSKFRLVDKAGKPQPELMARLETSWFEDLLQYVAEAVFFGHTVIELGELAAPGDLRQVYRIDQRNVLPYRGMAVKMPGDTTGYNIRKPPNKTYFIEVGRPDDLGLLARVAPVVIIKKYAIGSWSDYTEKYGIPPRWVTTNTTDKKRFKDIFDMLKGMMGGGIGMLQGDEKLEMAPTPGVDAHKVFDELIVRMNSEISKRVLGQDGTSDNKDASGTYGSLKVLQGVAEDRHQADKASVLYVINNELLPRLTLLGYPFANVRFQWDELRDMTPTELVSAVKDLGQVFEINPEYIEQRTGIKIDGIKRAPGEVSDSQRKGGTINPATGRQSGRRKPGQDPSARGDEDDEDDGGWPLATIPPCPQCGGRREPIAAAPVIGQAAIEQLLRDTFDGAQWSQPYFEEVTGAYSEGLLQTWRHELEQVNYDAPDHVARTLMEANLFRFGAAKTLAAALELNQHARESKGYSDYKKRVADSGLLENYNRRWMETEYVNAVATGQMASRWYQMQGGADALPNGEYLTAGDSQVRPAHAALDGKMWPLSDPIWNTIWPPNGWGCRCDVLPTQAGPAGEELQQQSQDVLGGLETSGELDRMRKSGFDQNRAITGQVFDLNRSYVDQLGDHAGKRITLGVDGSYGDRADRMRWDALKNTDLPAIDSHTPTVQAAQAWFERSKNDAGVIVLKDHAGRPISLTKAVLDRKLKQQPDRAQLVDQLGSVLHEPDEVWLDDKGDLVYLRFTDQGMVRVPVSIKRGEPLTIRSFYFSQEDSQRSGLLVKPYQQ